MAQSVSALICTRDRGASLVPTVASILHRQSPCAELLVIDQSTNNDTREALAPFMADARLRYVRDSSVGKGWALNLGLELARGEIVVITDDDCEVPSDWPAALVLPFEARPDVALVYGNVVAAPHDRAEGFVPTYHVRRERLVATPWLKATCRGIGANMAVRRDAMRAIGGFDVELGPGGRFRACIDGDVTMRFLLAGYHVFETERSTVIHFGFRDWERGRILARNAFYGIAAAYVKPLKAGRVSALPSVLYEFTVKCLVHSVWRTLAFRRPMGWARALNFALGAWDGLRHPIDRATLTYMPTRTYGSIEERTTPQENCAV